jgi:hypothetical protein
MEILKVTGIDWRKRRLISKLMEILKVTGIDWCKRRLISKPCMDQSVKLRRDHAEKRSVKRSQPRMLFVTDSIEGDRRKDSSDRKMRKKQAATR